jgi:hypothetical protein
MKRSAPLRRSGPLRSAKPLRRGAALRPGSASLRPGSPRRKARVNPVNRARRARLHERNFGDHAAWVRSHGCLVCKGPAEAAHVIPRKMGGCGGDKTVLVPLCSDHHREQEGKKVCFDLDLLVVAADLWATSPHNPANAAGLEVK